MRASLLFPMQPQSGDDALPYADLVKRRDAHRLWMGTSLFADTQQSLAYLAGAGYRIPVGTSVQLTPLRKPYAAALEARSLALLTGRSVIAGFGASAPEFVSYVRGAPYERPASAVRDYIAGVRALLDGHDGALPPAEHPRVELAAGVLRPGMARMCAGVADLAVTWMTPPDYLGATIAPALDEGAGTAPAPRIAAVVHAAIDRPGRDPRRLAYNGALGHLTQPHYADMLNRSGLAVRTDDPWSGAGLLVDNGIFLYGSAREVADGLRTYAAAGVDEVVVNPGGVGLTEGARAGAEDAAEILAHLRAG
ncbi:LLM class flavin-dependent oxidoreductase [Streptomonospora wellingtoniae]|uniref:LLM class flavin-dependent oxidoreductase n=1 Tax=Streptomonospora wellingtoniae TaxID=3075544 RepID=A0ABU2KT64_9ACTN|nr:LLM class flavin-dependent oxidoreductase [Streptomonospora sp. DSM 45055]MDT0302479.1 LLM class flavin-dependent oxidoreductase [Streptomonospora sp. DSM 45055]